MQSTTQTQQTDAEPINDADKISKLVEALKQIHATLWQPVSKPLVFGDERTRDYEYAFKVLLGDATLARNVASAAIAKAEGRQ